MTLRVLTLNLWNDEGDWPRRAARVREWIDRLDPDVVGLQEVVRGEGWDQAAEVLGGRGLYLDYGVASRKWKRPRLVGNAVGSRWPLGAREEIALPDLGSGEQRGAICVEVQAPFGAFAFTCTHLNWRFDHGFVRERQVVALADLVARVQPTSGFPPVIVGDLNAEPDSAEIRFLRGLQTLEGRSVAFLDAWSVAGGGGPGHTWSSRNPSTHRAFEPDRRIDYVLVGMPNRLAGGLGKVERCRVVCDDERDGVWPSDHLGVLAEIRTQPPTAQANGDAVPPQRRPSR